MADGGAAGQAPLQDPMMADLEDDSDMHEPLNTKINEQGAQDDDRDASAAALGETKNGSFDEQGIAQAAEGFLDGGAASMAVDGEGATEQLQAAENGQQPDSALCETPLPEEEQALVVAALCAAAAAATAPAQQMSPAAAAGPPTANDSAPSSSGAEEEAAAAPARVPARVLYGLVADDEGEQEQLQQARKLLPLPTMRRNWDDGRLPAYALAGSDDGGHHEGEGRGGRKGQQHADEDPPPGFQPTDVFIGGLPPGATEFDVWQAVVAAGEVVGVRLIRRRSECRGYGFVRMASREAAEAACQAVKEACGAPVALSLPSGQSLPELHAAAAAACAATPLKLPEDEQSSVAQLLQAVRRQKDPRSAVDTALVALLHVPSRARLAFPAGRPAPKEAAAADESPATKQQGGADGGKGSAAAPVEGLPDASNYLEPYPAVKALMAEYRNRGQDNKTPLAVLNEYAMRLALRVDVAEQVPPEGGPALVSIKLVNSRGGQIAATRTGRGRTKKIGQQIAGAALLEEILETVPAEDLLAPSRNKPGAARQGWQQQSRAGLGFEGGRGRGGRYGAPAGGRFGPEAGRGYGGPEAGRGGRGRGAGRFGGEPRPRYERPYGRDEGPGFAHGPAPGGPSRPPQPQMQTAAQSSGGPVGLVGFVGGQTAGFPGAALQQQQQQQLLQQAQLQRLSVQAALPGATALAPAQNLAASQPGSGYGGALTVFNAAGAAGVPAAAGGYSSTMAAAPANVPGLGSNAGAYAAPRDPRLGRLGAQVQPAVGTYGQAQQQPAAAANGGYGQAQAQQAAAYGAYAAHSHPQQPQHPQQQQQQHPAASAYSQSSGYGAGPTSQQTYPPMQQQVSSAGQAAGGHAAAAERKYISNTAQQQQARAAAQQQGGAPPWSAQPTAAYGSAAAYDTAPYNPQATAAAAYSQGAYAGYAATAPPSVAAQGGYGQQAQQAQAQQQQAPQGATGAATPGAAAGSVAAGYYGHTGYYPYPTGQ